MGGGVGEKNGPFKVGTHESIESEGVRCVKGYSVVVLTGTDAQTERPYSSRPAASVTSNRYVIRRRQNKTSPCFLERNDHTVNSSK